MKRDPKLKPGRFGMTGQLSAIVNASNYDPHPVSVLRFGEPPEEPRHDGRVVWRGGAVVVIKDPDVLGEFEAWAKAKGFCDPARPSKMNAAFEKARS